MNMLSTYAPAVSIQQALPAIFALLVGIAGWFYLFYSKAAERLASVEDQRINARRIALRRVGGVVMLLLAIGIAVGMYGFDLERLGSGFFLVWLGVMVLLVVVVVLALIDLRLTRKLRASRRKTDQ